ncbi:glutamine-hydrolyzing carbamoyl-phosphate synthase small subunit [bacterium]|nr:glutamine-hydrolyzing carbamoyl-phosphate synthase small subunit [bacterium]
MTKEAHLILADGTIYSGKSFGYEGNRFGEVVFNTALSGYQEILTDPSYAGQIVVMTYPQIGNYGINPMDVESRGLFLSGFVVKENSPIVSNYRSSQDLGSYLKKWKVPGVEGVDTRALVRKIRDGGAQQALIVVGPLKNKNKLLEQAKNLPSMEGQDLAKTVSSTKKSEWKEGVVTLEEELSKKRSKVKAKYHVVAYDFGMKQNISRLLTSHGCKVTIVPSNTPAEEVLKYNPDGIFLSNGPGDPAMCEEPIKNVKKLLGKKPMFGICLGHQIMALALGAKTYKLKFGHHGGNQPVMDVTTGKVEITSQNHGFAVDDTTLPKDVTVTHINLNDRTVEGIEHKKQQAFCVQYHPEAAPGPHDSAYLFKRFTDMMDKR